MLKYSSSLVSLFLIVFSGFVLANSSHAVAAQDPAQQMNPDVSGKWIVNAEFFGTTISFRMHLKEEAGKLTGDFDGDKLQGTVTGNSIHFVAKDEQGGTEESTATVKDGTISGTIVFTDAGDPTHPGAHAFRPILEFLDPRRNKLLLRLRLRRTHRSVRRDTTYCFHQPVDGSLGGSYRQTLVLCL
jgi:hypothetical protein